MGRYWAYLYTVSAQGKSVEQMNGSFRPFRSQLKGRLLGAAFPGYPLSTCPSLDGCLSYHPVYFAFSTDHNLKLSCFLFLFSPRKCRPRRTPIYSVLACAVPPTLRTGLGPREGALWMLPEWTEHFHDKINPHRLFVCLDFFNLKISIYRKKKERNIHSYTMNLDPPTVQFF